MKRFVVALVVGLLAASVPIVATSGQCPQTLSSEAPRYLVFASDDSAHRLGCIAGSSIAFERVRSVEAVSAHLSDEHVAGVVIDPQTNAAMPQTAMREWMGVGDGRAVFGLDLAHPDVVAGKFELPNEAELHRRGIQSMGRAYAYVTAHGGRGGGGIIEYVATDTVRGIMLDTARTLLVR